MVARPRCCPECGGGLPDPAGEPVVVCRTCHRVTFLGREGRAPSAPLPFGDPGCRDLTVTGRASTVASSQRDGHAPDEAIDGHRGSMWHAGGAAPAWWCADLGEVQPVRGVTLVPAMTPAIGAVVHVIETCTGGEDWAVRATLDQSMTDGAVYAVPFDAAADARWVRIRTTASPSQVAWYEIGIFG